MIIFNIVDVKLVSARVNYMLWSVAVCLRSFMLFSITLLYIGTDQNILEIADIIFLCTTEFIPVAHLKICQSLNNNMMYLPLLYSYL